MYLKLFIIFVASGSVNSELFKILNAVLEFGIVNDIKDMNFRIGVSMAKGQLDILEKNVTEKHIRSTIQTLQDKCDTILNKVKPTDLFALAFHTKLWTFKSHPKPLLAPRSLSGILPPLSREGPLKPSLSDDCLNLILSQCNLTQTCLSAETSDTGGGYQFTHQVLYLTILIQNCAIDATNTSKIQEIIHQKCAIVLHQHHDIEEKGLPPSMRDLYIEQIVLCGMHGLSEFFTPNIETLLHSLQLDQGCFSVFKDSESLERNCDIHLSGLAAAVLSLTLKHQMIPGGN